MRIKKIGVLAAGLAFRPGAPATTPPHVSLRVAILAVAALAAQAGADGPRFRFEDLGIPRTVRAVQSKAVVGDTLLATVFETKGTNRLVVVDLPSGRQEELPLAGSTGADALAVDEAGGSVYVGSSNKAGVWRFESVGRRLTRIASLDPLLVSETYVWSVAVGSGGVVFVGTYPGGLLLEHNPSTGRSRSLGAPLPGRKYVRGMLVGPSGTVYTALGTPAAVVAVDPRNGRKHTLFEAEAGSVFPEALHLEAGVLHVGGTRIPVAEPSPPPPAPTQVEVDLEGRFSVRSGSRTFEGRLDLASKQDGMGIMGLAKGPDGAVYGPTYYNASLFRVDVATGEISSLGRVAGADGEFRVLQDLGEGRLFLPGYKGQLYIYELGRSWGQANPRRIGELGHGQHLATAVDRLPDGTVILATPPDYGRRGGALTVLNSKTLSWRTFDGLVKDQAMSAVCFGPQGLVFAGTSVDVGPGETAVAKMAHLIVVDPVSGAKRYDTPLPGATSINSIVPLGPRRVLGGTDTGELFTFDWPTRTRRVVTKLPHIRDLRLWDREGAVLGIGWRKGLFLVDPRSLAVTWIVDSPPKLLPGIAFDAEGRAYVHDGTRVFRISRAKTPRVTP